MHRLPVVGLALMVLAAHQTGFAQAKKPAFNVQRTHLTIPPTFSDDDVTLLKMLGSGYYLNRKFITYDVPQPQQHVEILTKLASAPQSKGQQTLAAHLLLQASLCTAVQGSAAEQNLLLKRMSGKFIEAGLIGAIDGITLGDVAEFAEIKKQGVIEGIVAIGDRMRVTEIKKTVIEIVLTQAVHDALDAIETSIAAPLGEDNIAEQVKIKAMNQDEVKVTEMGESIPIQGQHVRVNIVGDKALTNVLLVGRVDSKGIDFTPNQQSGLATITALNQGFGYGDKNEDVVRLSLASNYLHKMSKGRCIYIEALFPGDVLHFPIATVHWDVVDAGKLSLFCDQGRLKSDLFWSKPMVVGKSQLMRSKSEMAIEAKRRTADAEKERKAAQYEMQKATKQKANTKRSP